MLIDCSKGSKDIKEKKRHSRKHTSNEYKLTKKKKKNNRLVHLKSCSLPYGSYNQNVKFAHSLHILDNLDKQIETTVVENQITISIIALYDAKALPVI